MTENQRTGVVSAAFVLIAALVTLFLCFSSFVWVNW